ncbi:hypothetical protein ACFQHW_12380 [Lapidilactobacillus achengensis]|uniref:TPR repeat-containing protein n=1 Tax=Lapidilactobacillus achengensis TaxID=2486000 RepID=A0ABW1UUQ2_9LACO|nr:hypothetical protein [Lapidilactobacillus achengensis]
MSQFPESVQSLMTLAAEAAEQDNYSQALKYLNQALAIEPDFTVIQAYLETAKAAESQPALRQLLRAPETVQAFATARRLPDYWQALWSAGLYLTLDQSGYDLAQNQAALNGTDLTTWQAWVQRVGELKLSASEFAQWENRLQQLTLTQLNGDVADFFTDLATLPPQSFYRLSQTLLLNALLSPVIRFQLLLELAAMSQTKDLSIFWQGEVRQFSTQALQRFEQSEPYVTLRAGIDVAIESGQLADSQRDLAQSNLLTYLMLTAPFSQAELQPLAAWQQLVLTGRVPTDVSQQTRAHLNFWQGEETKLLRSLQ